MGLFNLRLHYGWVIVLTGVLSILGALGFGRFGYTMILPSMKEGLKLTYSQMGLLGTANFTGYLIFSLIGGFLAAKYGPRMVITYSLLFVGLTMFLTGLANSFVQALIMRFLTGVGSGGVNVPTMALASAWFNTKRRGLASGIMVSGSSFGLIITGLLVPPILYFFSPQGWRYSWYLLGLLVLIIGGISYAFIRNNPEEKGLSPIGEAFPTSASTSIGWEFIYKSRVLRHLATIYFMFGFSYVIYSTFFAAYLTKEGNLTKETAGYLWSLVGILSIACGLIWGTLSDFIGRRYGLAIVYGLQAVSYLLFASAQAITGYYLSALLYGITAWSIPSIMAAAAGDYVGAKLAPAALGVMTIIFGLGAAMGPPLAGWIVDRTGSFVYAFLLSSLVATIGLIGSLLLKPPR